jgi:hypothetical protein
MARAETRDRVGMVHRVSGWPQPELVHDPKSEHLLNDF